MDHEQVMARLNDFVDGELADADAREVAEHLRSCGACRREHAELLALRDDAAALPRAMAPRRDLWPGIVARIAGDADAVGTAPPPRDRRVPGEVAATRPARAGRGAGRSRTWWAVLSGSMAAAMAVVVVVVGFRATIGERNSRTNSPVDNIQERNRVITVPTWEASAVVAAMAAETWTDSRSLNRSGTNPSPMAANWLPALVQDRATVERAVAELQAAYLAHPRDAKLAHQLGRVCAMRAALDARMALIQEIL